MPVAEPAVTDRTERAARYRDGLARYREAVGAAVPAGATDDYRLEHHFECLCDWSLFHDLDGVVRWFEAERAASPMRVEEIPLTGVTGWEIEADTGNLHHAGGAFFRIVGVRTTLTERREVGATGWDQPIIAEVTGDGGILGILRQRFDGVPHYLIEAKAEPGNVDGLQLSPTLQATQSNLRRAHKGRKPAYAELFEAPDEHGASVLYRAWLSEDGGRLYKKRNLGMLVEATAAAPAEPPDGFIWLSMYQIKALLHRDAWVNPHIRGIIAHW